MFFLGFLILLFLTLLLFLKFRQIFKTSIKKMEENLERVNEREKGLNELLCSLKEKKRFLEKNLEETIYLYEFSKEVRSFLDIQRIFELFKERINTAIKIEEVRLITDMKEKPKFKDYYIVDLQINHKSMGFIAIKNLENKDLGKFNILFQQFLAGIQGAYLFKKIQELSILDSLTGVFNRRAFLERLKEEIERARRNNLKLAFLMFDIDYFKSYNDRYGHLVGDAILREVTQLIKENIRQIDFMGRYGGEEFCVVLPETDKKNGFIVAERIRKAVQEKEIKAYDEALKVTLSVGIDEFPSDAEDITSLIEKADQALYQAKFKGRNCVCVWGEIAS